MADPCPSSGPARCPARRSEPDAAQTCASYFAEFGRIENDGSVHTIETDFGLANLRTTDKALHIVAESRDETGLAFVKLSLAEHLLRLSSGMSPSLTWKGHGEAGSPLPYFREMEVMRVAELTSRMRRITLSGSDLARFAMGGLHVRLLFPPDGSVPAWPVTGPMAVRNGRRGRIAPMYGSIRYVGSTFFRARSISTSSCMTAPVRAAISRGRLVLASVSG